MANAKLDQTVWVELTLSEEEAEWLKDRMQNPMPGDEEKDELIEESIFNALKGALG